VDRLDRAAMHELELDSADKFSALNLDNICFNLRNTSRGIHYHDGIERIDNTLVGHFVSYLNSMIFNYLGLINYLSPLLTTNK